MMMNSLIVFIFSLMIGSFINVIIYRLPLGKSLIWPGSFCPACSQAIKARDLVPVISYIVLNGECRHCRARISLRYPLVELLTGTAFLLVYLNSGSTICMAAGLFLTGLLIASAFIDIDHGIIPDKLTGIGIIVGLLLSPFTVTPLSAAAGSLLFGGILFSAGVLSGGGMGGGDIKLGLAIGVFCGLPNAVLAFIISSLAGGVWGGFLLMTRSAGRKSTMKFGPFLALGSYLAYVYGSQIINCYFRILGLQ